MWSMLSQVNNSTMIARLNFSATSLEEDRSQSNDNAHQSHRQEEEEEHEEEQEQHEHPGMAQVMLQVY